MIPIEDLTAEQEALKEPTIDLAARALLDARDEIAARESDASGHRSEPSHQRHP
jgi:hypothetical protein